MRSIDARGAHGLVEASQISQFSARAGRASRLPEKPPQISDIELSEIKVGKRWPR
jgi:hypothetical protein